MKIRTGFVSNSSSTSYVVVILPKNFDPAKAVDDISEDAKKKLTENLKTLMSTGKYSCYPGDTDDDKVSMAVNDYILYSHEVEDGGCGRVCIEVIKEDEIKRISKLIADHKGTPNV